MKNVTIISYPGARDDSLLSLSELRSRYMIPFGGRYRIIDFTLRNSVACGAEKTIIYTDMHDDLEQYIKSHSSMQKEDSAPIKVVSNENFNLDSCISLLKEHETNHYIFYNGANPSIIDFEKVLKKYKSKKTGTVLFKIKIGNKATMAYTILVTNKRSINSVFKQAKKEGKNSPNVFEMLINMFVNNGIKSEAFSAYYRPLKNIPEYYEANMELCKNEEICDMVFDDKYLVTGIASNNMAEIGANAEIKNTFISDGCHINGSVSDSIIFPGVIIAEKAIIKRSIILPNVAIGRLTRIEKSIIDEYTDLNQSEVLFNIAEKCNIGSDEEGLKNNVYPDSLYSSITLIGKNTLLPESANIGSACYVAAGLGYSAFRKTRTLHDGLVINPKRKDK